MDWLSFKFSSVLFSALDNVQLSWPSIILAAALILTIVHTLRVVYQPGLRTLSGNWLAPFSQLYKIYLVYDGRCPEKERAMHKKYGPVVRTGPYHVSFSDPAAIPSIYGITLNFLKVGSMRLFLTCCVSILHSLFSLRVISILPLALGTKERSSTLSSLREIRPSTNT